MSFYHDPCGSYLVIDVTKAFKIFASAGISDKGLSLGPTDIYVGSTDIVTEFYCPNCEKAVDQEHTYCVCSECGAKIPLGDAFKLKGVGGIFCKKHAEGFASLDSSKMTPMAKIASNIKMK